MTTDHASSPGRDRGQTTMVMLAGLVGLALVAAMITRTSEAAFSATTQNTGNYFNGGTVTLTDDGVSALFSVDAMDPGSTSEGCIEVSYDGTITTPSPVVIYSGGYTNVSGPDVASAGLSDYLDIVIDEGSLAAFNDCSTFTLDQNILAATDLTTFSGASTDYATGVGAWTPTATGETKAYRIRVTLDGTIPDTEEGAGTTGVTFVWEVQS